MTTINKIVKICDLIIKNSVYQPGSGSTITFWKLKKSIQDKIHSIVHKSHLSEFIYDNLGAFSKLGITVKVRNVNAIIYYLDDPVYDSSGSFL